MAGDPPDSPATPVTLRLHFSGPAGDFVSGGETVDATADPSFPATLSADASQVGVEFVDHLGRSGSLALSGAGGAPLRVGHYDPIVRAGLGPGPQTGFALSFDGRGCNQISGSLDITRLQRRPSGPITHLEASFTQSCDGGPRLTGTVALSSP